MPLALTSVYLISTLAFRIQTIAQNPSQSKGSIESSASSQGTLNQKTRLCNAYSRSNLESHRRQDMHQENLSGTATALHTPPMHWMAISLAYRASSLVDSSGSYGMSWMKKSVSLLQHAIGKSAMFNLKLPMCDALIRRSAITVLAKSLSSRFFRPLGVPPDCLKQIISCLADSFF